MQTFDKTFTAGETQHFPGGFQFFLLESGADVDIIFYDRMRKKIGEAKGIESGFNLKKKDGFSGVDMTSATVQTVKVWIGYDSESDYAPSQEVAIPSPESFESIADVTVGSGTEILAANSNRKEAIIAALSSNALVVRIGDSGVAVGNGLELSPGQSVVLTTQAAIYGQSSGSQKVCVAYTED